MSTEDDPEWLPEAYDRDANLADRLEVIDEIDSGIGIEVWASDDRGVTKVLGTPHRVEESGLGVLTLYVGGREFNWDYEVIVPANDANPRVESVNPDQDIEAYQRSKFTELENVDVRIYGVDHERLEETEVPA